MSKTYKIGTRGSLLAVTQCTLIAEEMSKLTGANFELIKIKTQGDLQTEKPLWQMDGKDFFTKELDHALLTNEVDLVVHSYKDLGSDRPEGISLAAITERKFANDIFLIKKETLTQLHTINEINIGTSSPRRIVNIESSLKPYLPNAKETATVKCSMLRGNVNTRIQKLKDGNYHGIVLALAGLERLAHKEESFHELKTLLADLTFIVLPQNDFPSSASQGALAIEFNSVRNDQDLLKVLKSVHSIKTAEEVKREREAFKSFGGGCHLAVGINIKSHKNLFIHNLKGEHNNTLIHKRFLEGIDYSKLKGLQTFIPLDETEHLISKELKQTNLSDRGNYFVTSKYCFEAIKDLKESTLWAAGDKTLKRLTQKGHWVSGSADSLGHEEIQKLNSSLALKLMMPTATTKVLSHDKATSPIGETVPCYSRTINNSVPELKEVDLYYWNSFFQYETYVRNYPWLKEKQHACGIGKTYDKFQSESISVFPFLDLPSFKEQFN